METKSPRERCWGGEVGWRRPSFGDRAHFLKVGDFRFRIAYDATESSFRCRVGTLTLLYDQSGNRKYLNPAERRLFFDKVVSSGCLGRKSFCLVLLYTGCRISEALSLTKDSIDEAERNLVFKTLKQRGSERRRALPIPRDLIEILVEQAATGSGEKIWSFTRSTGWRIVKDFMAMAALTGTKASPKGLRHAFAIDNLSNEVPLTTISKWLGHASIDTTKIYLDFIGSEERALARRAWPTMEAISPSQPQSQSGDLVEREVFPTAAFDRSFLAEIDRCIRLRLAGGWVLGGVEQVNRDDPESEMIVLRFEKVHDPSRPV